MNQGEMVLIHLSDIHFRRDYSGTIYDRDIDVRNQLEIDAEKMRRQLGSIRGILLTGDIAFSGKKEEYQTALEWLQRFCDRAGCSLEDVWTVPGNHDVDRSVISASTTLQDCREKFRRISVDEIDREIQRYMADKSAREVLFEPLGNYNEFASAFACQISADKPYWHDDLTLNDGSTLRLRGLNSTLISNSLDNDAEYKLILGSVQATCSNEDGVEYITLCHHPPQWLRDQDNVEDYLDSRVRVQLFGHKHRFRVRPGGRTVRIAAGAMHPDEREPNWQPRYNLISLMVNNDGESRRLNVQIHPRVWSDAEKLFTGEINRDDTTFHTCLFELEQWSPATPVEIKAARPNIPAAISNNEPALQDANTDAVREDRPMNRNRRLTYRFYTLPYNVRLRVVQELNLVHDEDRDVPEAKLFERYFKRAQDGRILEHLWDAVEHAHPDKRFNDNPFAGE
jgi:calcineurin-like phosphoesterase family protein